MTDQHNVPAVATAPIDPVDAGRDNSYLQDPGLASLLSRLAALQGHSVPAYRFGMLDRTPDGVVLSDLPRGRRAVELWMALFPAGKNSKILPEKIQRSDFPLIWISDNGERALLLRGRLSHGACNAEDPEGNALELSLAELNHGEVLALEVDVQFHAASPEEMPKTAGDWFVFTVRRYRSAFMDAVFATIVVSIIGLFSAIYSMQVYDRVVPSKGYSTLFVLTVGVVIAIIMELVLKEVRVLIVERACKVIDQELSAIFFGKALDIRMDARPRTVGTFAAQIRHFESVRQFMTSTTLFVLADVPFALLFVGVIAMISPWVALAPLLLVPLAIVAGWMFRKPIEECTAMHMNESNKKNGLLIEAIDGIESIKASNGEWKMLNRWRELVATIGQSEIRMKMLSSLSSQLTQTIQQFSYVAMVCIGAYLITIGELTMGGLIACTIISGRALNPIAQISGIIVQWKHAEIALKSLDGIMALPSDRDPETRLIVPERCEGHLLVDKVGFAYRPGAPAVEVPALQFVPGERVAIIGAVGCGKSTLIKILSGLYKPTLGSVYLDKIDITHLAPEFVREHIGYLPQDVRLFQGSLRDNLTLGLPMPSDSQILRAAAQTGLDAIIQAHPKGLELEISEGGRGLSGGQRQLVGLTRMLLAQPRIMLLDEPTASMDNQLEANVMQHLFNGVAKDSILIVITHKLNFLPLVNRLIVMDKGRIVLDGPREAVLDRLRQNAAQQQAQQQAQPRVSQTQEGAAA